jgi:hypothetical protein
MWICPFCNEGGGNFQPYGHRHYLFHYRPNDDVDSEELPFLGPRVGTAKIDEFMHVVTLLMDFEDGSRRKALASLDRIVTWVPSFPVHLRDFLRVCLEHQREWTADEGGCALGRLGSDVNDYIRTVLGHSTKDLRINHFRNDYAPQTEWDYPHHIYWTEDPESSALDCANRLGEDIRHLKRLRLRGAKYVVDR